MNHEADPGRAGLAREGESGHEREPGTGPRSCEETLRVAGLMD
jgi:hypothetical protein